MVGGRGLYLDAVSRRRCVFDGVCRGPGRVGTLILVLARRSRGAELNCPGTVRSSIDLGMAGGWLRELAEAVLLYIGDGILDLGLGDLEGWIVELDLELAVAAYPESGPRARPHVVAVSFGNCIHLVVDALA